MKVFIDTNIILEGKPLEDLPWADIGNDETIAVLLVPTVLKEVDKKKRDGRLGKKARAFNRLIAPAATAGDTITVRAEAPRVTLEIAEIARIDWDQYDTLDRDDPDACIVAEIIAEKSVPGDDKLIISQDINPLRMARGLGLKAHHISDAWLAPQEPSPQEKQLARLKQKVLDLESTEPDLEICITAPTDPVQIISFESLSGSEQYDLEKRILDKAPTGSSRDPFNVMPRDYSFSDRLESYRTQKVPAYVSSFAKNLGLVFAQVPFSVTIANTGVVRADRLIVEIVSKHATIHEKYVLLAPNGPPAPRERDFMAPLMPRIPLSPALAGKHDMFFDIEPERGGRKIEIHCEDFRQGRKWMFDGIITLDPDDIEAAELEVRVTASNLHGAVVDMATIGKNIRGMKVDEAVDLDEGRFILDLPMRALIDEAIERDDLATFEFIHDDGDE